MKIEVFPLSFKESVHVKLGNRHYDKLELGNYFLEYMKYGGFPSVVLSDVDIKSRIISNLFNSIFLNDIVSYNKIKENVILEYIINFLLSNVGQLISISSILNIFQFSKIEISVNTIIRYLKFIEDAYLIYKTDFYNFDKKYNNNSMYYVVDNGIKRYANANALLQNIVYIELLRRGYSIFVYPDNENTIFDVSMNS